MFGCPKGRADAFQFFGRFDRPRHLEGFVSVDKGEAVLLQRDHRTCVQSLHADLRPLANKLADQVGDLGRPSALAFNDVGSGCDEAGRQRGSHLVHRLKAVC